MSGEEEDRRGARELLDQATELLQNSGVPSPRWDAEVLLGQVFGCSRGDLPFLLRGADLSGEQAERFWTLVERRARREPLQHICGSWDFIGLELAVDRRALIPRPETEILVETVVGRLKEMGVCGGGSLALAADVGMGTGAIALALARFCPQLKVLATDVSADALDLATENARRLGLEGRVEFARGDLLEPVAAWLGRSGRAEAAPGGAGQAGLVALVSNPPYIPSAEIEGLQPEVACHDPRLALDGGLDGLDFYRRLIPGALPLLRAGGGLCAVEVGFGQAQDVAAMFRDAGYTKVSVTKDLSGVERVILGYRP